MPFIWEHSRRYTCHGTSTEYFADVLTKCMTPRAACDQAVTSTGLLLRLRIWQRLETEELYSDHRYFVVHDEPQPKAMEIDNGKEDTGM